MSTLQKNCKIFCNGESLNKKHQFLEVFIIYFINVNQILFAFLLGNMLRKLAKRFITTEPSKISKTVLDFIKERQSTKCFDNIFYSNSKVKQ